jgi:hypothetical protein
MGKIGERGRIQRNCLVIGIDTKCARSLGRRRSVDHANYAGTAPGACVGRGSVAGVQDLFVLHRGIGHMVEIKKHRLASYRTRSSP